MHRLIQTRWLQLTMGVALAAALSACGDSNDSPTAPAATATATAIPSATFTAVPPTATRTFTATSVPATATNSPVPTATATNTNTPQPTATPTSAVSFHVQSSVEQLLIDGAEPGLMLDVADGGGIVLESGRADDQGTLIFRDLPPGTGYVVSEDNNGVRRSSRPTAVWTRDQTPPQSFYANQQVVNGYQYITTRDGTQLAINVILPGPIENGPYPTLVEYSGYDPANPDAPQPSTLIGNALEYAVVGINMRGTGCSGGSFKFFETAQDTDGYDAVEVIAAQPWAKFHKVGMVGISYPGISQLFVAQLQPPSLASIAPLSVISDTGRGTLYPGGILNNGFATGWADERQADARPFGQAWSKKRRDNGDQVCIDNQRFRGQNPDLPTLIAENNFYVPAVADPIAPVTFVNKINVPVFLAGAWQDEQTGGYFPNMLDRFTGEKVHFTITNGGHTDSLGPQIFTRWSEFLSFYVRREIPVLPGLAKVALTVIAQQVFGITRVAVPPDRFGSEPSFESALAKFEAEPRVRVLYDNGAGDTRQPGAPVPGFEHGYSNWPIADLEPGIWYFNSNGRLTSNTPSDGSGADSFLYDPTHGQQTTLHGDSSLPWIALPPWDWKQDDSGKAVAYASDPLPNTLVMTGNGSVDLWVKSTALDTDLQVQLSEIRPDGKETFVQAGWLRASHRKVNQTESTIFRPFHDHLQVDAANLPAGQFVEARVELYPFAHVFRAGSRIRITVDTPGDTRPSWKFDILQPNGPVTNSIGRSAATPSRIVLPIVPNIAVTTPLPPCPALRAMPCRNYVATTNTAE